MDYALIIALVSLVISGLTFYFTHLRPARIFATVGPILKAYYTDYEVGEGFALYLPVTLTNTASRFGAVVDAAIMLYRIDSPQERYFMQWREFSKLDTQTKIFVYEEMAHGLAIPGKSAIYKMIWFVWKSDSQPKLVLQKGAYRIIFFYWSDKNKSPKNETHGFFITDSLLRQIEYNRANKKSLTIDIRLDQQLDENKSMTENESKKQLGL